MSQRKFAIVTGASSGIGLEIARLAAEDGYDLLVAADEPLVDATARLKDVGVEVRGVEADLATEAGVKHLLQAAGDRPVDVLVANAGHGLGHAVSLASDVVAGLELSQQLNCCFLQKKQSPQAIGNGMITRWPFFRVLFAPTSTTSPINSWPRMSPARMPGM